VGNRPRYDESRDSRIVLGTVAAGSPILILGFVVSFWVAPGGWWLLFAVGAIVYGLGFTTLFLRRQLRDDQPRKRRSQFGH
jgi:hypothetical protein